MIFGAYSCIFEFDSLTLILIEHVASIKIVMKKVQKVKVEKQVADVLNQKNKPDQMVFVMHNLPLNFDISFCQKDNTKYNNQLTESYKMLVIKNKTCIL